MKPQPTATRAKGELSAEEYQLLVDELMKDAPDQNLIRKLMSKQGLPYTQDPISQMSLVLQSMSTSRTKTKEATSV